MITKKLFYFLLIPLLAFKCKKPLESDYPIDIINNSDDSIAFYVAGVGVKLVYPDTALLFNKPAMQVIPPGQLRTWSVSYPLEDFFQMLPADTLHAVVGVCAKEFAWLHQQLKGVDEWRFLTHYLD